MARRRKRTRNYDPAETHERFRRGDYVYIWHNGAWYPGNIKRWYPGTDRHGTVAQVVSLDHASGWTIYRTDIENGRVITEAELYARYPDAPSTPIGKPYAPRKGNPKRKRKPALGFDDASAKAIRGRMQAMLDAKAQWESATDDQRDEWAAAVDLPWTEAFKSWDQIDKRLRNHMIGLQRTRNFGGSGAGRTYRQGDLVPYVTRYKAGRKYLYHVRFHPDRAAAQVASEKVARDAGWEFLDVYLMPFAAWKAYTVEGADIVEAWRMSKAVSPEETGFPPAGPRRRNPQLVSSAAAAGAVAKKSGSFTVIELGDGEVFRDENGRVVVFRKAADALPLLRHLWSAGDRPFRQSNPKRKRARRKSRRLLDRAADTAWDAYFMQEHIVPMARSLARSRNPARSGSPWHQDLMQLEVPPLLEYGEFEARYYPYRPSAGHGIKLRRDGRPVQSTAASRQAAQTRHSRRVAEAYERYLADHRYAVWMQAEAANKTKRMFNPRRRNPAHTLGPRRRIRPDQVVKQLLARLENEGIKPASVEDLRWAARRGASELREMLWHLALDFRGTIEMMEQERKHDREDVPMAELRAWRRGLKHVHRASDQLKGVV